MTIPSSGARECQWYNLMITEITMDERLYSHSTSTSVHTSALSVMPTVVRPARALRAA